MPKIKILLVEDEKTLVQIVSETLRGQGFIVETAADGVEGLRRFFEVRPDVLVADVMMPRMDGFEMVRRIRKTDDRTPVLFLTAKSTPDDVVTGFELGANDYLKKPFAIQELIVRIKALMGKAYMTERQEMEQSEYLIGDYRFLPVTQALEYIPDGTTNSLSHRETEILSRLCRAEGAIVPMQNLLLDLWGDDDFFNARSLQVFITRLRRSLSKDPRIRIVNVRGSGYKLIVADY